MPRPTLPDAGGYPLALLLLSTATAAAPLLAAPAAAQVTVAPAAPVAASATARVTATDYARAEQFLPWNTETLVPGVVQELRWLPGDRFWYRVTTRDGHRFLLVDAPRNERRPVFDHERLAAALSLAADTSYEGRRLPFREFELLDDGRAIHFQVKDSVRWTCDVVAYTCVGPDSLPGPARDVIASPDGHWEAFEREENLWIRALDGGEERQLSSDGEEHWGYAVVPEGCCQEITSRRQKRKRPPVLAWSPDSRLVATHRYDERDVAEFHLLEARDGRPILHSWRYALPGDSVVPTFDIHVFPVDGGPGVRMEHPGQPGFFTSGDSLWADVQWERGGERLWFTARSRDFKRVELLVADAGTGAVRRVLEETGPTYVELNQTSGGRPNWRVLAGGDVLWFSERDGWGHLYRFDGATGALRNPVTSGPWLVVDLLAVDDERGLAWFTAVGREEGRDRYHRHLYRVGLDGSGLRLLTPEDGDHDVQVSPSGRFFVDTYSRRDTIPVTVLRDREGRVVRTLEQGDAVRLLATGWRWPTPFVVKGRDAVTEVHGLLYFPSNFDPEARYPVVDYVYPGPQVGPIGYRTFRSGPSGNPAALAELGFIVFTVDAMGTPLRSKAFHDAYYGDMGDNGLPDHIAALKRLAAVHPQMDLGRVGIYGHSGGGFASTDAILRYPDFFKVAVSAAGNHDNRGYHFPWAEKYQGLLVRDSAKGGDNYDGQANQALAANLRGKLLLSYGTLDDNVHPNMTLRVIDELIEHNRDFDLMVLPNRNHGYGSEPYWVRRTWDYFVRHLLGQEPPPAYEIKRPDNP